MHPGYSVDSDSNPYRVPGSPVSADRSRPAARKHVHFALLLFCGGCAVGALFGGMAAALIGLLASLLTFDLTQSGGMTMEWWTVENVIVCAVVGAILGGLSYGTLACPIALVAFIKQASQRWRNAMVICATTLTCSVIGTIGGVACAVLINGGGFDGKPVSPVIVLLGAGIGFAFGAMGGLVHGRLLRNCVVYYERQAAAD